LHRYCSAARFGAESHSLHYSHPSKRSVFSGKFTSLKVSIWFTKIICILLYLQSYNYGHLSFLICYFLALPQFLHRLIFPTAQDFCHVIVSSAHSHLCHPETIHFPTPFLPCPVTDHSCATVSQCYNSQPS